MAFRKIYYVFQSKITCGSVCYRNDQLSVHPVQGGDGGLAP